MSFGTKLQELRNQKNITQEDLADQLEVTRQTISRWETDTVYPDLKKVVQLSNILGVSTDYLLKNEDDSDMLSTKPVSKFLLELVGKKVDITFYTNENEITFDKFKYVQEVLSVDNKNMTVLFTDKKKNTKEERTIHLSDVSSIRIMEE